MLGFLVSPWTNLLHLFKVNCGLPMAVIYKRKNATGRFKDNPREIGFASNFFSFSVIANVGQLAPKCMKLCIGYLMGDLRTLYDIMF